jgi:predicted ATPase/DNA-binding SARP family transcriptional activator
MTSSVTFSVLGEVSAGQGGRPLDLGGPRQRALLALLLVRLGRTISVDELADELWAGEPPDGAPVTVRTYISRLRAALGPSAPIVHAAAGYWIDVAREQLDASVFADRVRDAGEAAAQSHYADVRRRLLSALELWHGQPFGGLAQDGLLRVEAERLDELRLRALELRIEADIELGRGADVVDELELLVGEQPFRERLWRLLMLALYHAGRQADALAAFQRARRVLVDQLGLDPSPELQQLEAQVLRHEVPPPRGRARGSQLPEDLTTFVGREAELAAIADRLASARLVTLTGVGGVGKTRLAIAAARREARDAPGGAIFVDLAPATDAAAVRRTVTRALGLRDTAGVSAADAAAADAITAELANARVLIVLDNCEHLADAAAELAELLISASPGVRVLATSRGPLGSQGEAEFAVAPFSTPSPNATPDEMRSSDSVRLLMERVRALRPIVGDEAQLLREAARICRDLDGIPLAIELAAARSKALTLNEIAARLDDRFKFLVSWRRVSAARHQTLRQAMDWSYDLLGPSERRLLADLSVFAGGFDGEAAAQVCIEGNESGATDLLGRLVEASLLTADTNRDRTRYSMLETVRQYAAAHLEEEGRTEELRRAHADYFAALAERAEPELVGVNQLQWFGRLDAELANFRTALAHMAKNGADGQRLLEFTVSLTRFWYVRGHLAEARDQLENSLRQAGEVGAPLRRRALTAAASVALLQGDYPTATDFAERSLEVARSTGEQRLVANGLSNLGAILLAGGERERSGELLTEAVAIARAVDDTRILALALNNLGDHALTAGNYERAEPLFAESLDLLRQRGDTANVARSLFNLGAVALRRGRPEEAERFLREGLAAGRSAGDKEDICWCLLGYAALSRARGQADRAATLLGAAAALLAQMGAAFKPFERMIHDDTVTATRLSMGDRAFEVARARGAQMALDDAAELAVAG